MEFTDDSGASHGHDNADGRRRADSGHGESSHGQARSVAEEAALLVDLLGARGWAGFSGSSAQQPDGGSADHAHAPSSASTGPCTCGGQQPAACRLCPVCQLISFVQGISPETIERVADVVDLAATALRDLATTQRARHETAGGAAPDGAMADTEPADPDPTGQDAP